MTPKCLRPRCSIAIDHWICFCSLYLSSQRRTGQCQRITPKPEAVALKEIKKNLSIRSVKPYTSVKSWAMHKVSRNYVQHQKSTIGIFLFAEIWRAGWWVRNFYKNHGCYDKRTSKTIIRWLLQRHHQTPSIFCTWSSCASCPSGCPCADVLFAIAYFDSYRSRSFASELDPSTTGLLRRAYVWTDR